MSPQKKLKRVVALDGHRLGLVNGMAIALVVMAFSFFYQHVEFLTTGIRVGWAFVAAYGATFFLIRVILRTTLFEFLAFEQKDPKGRSRLGRAEYEGEDESVADLPATATPHELLAQQAGGLTTESNVEASAEIEL